MQTIPASDWKPRLASTSRIAEFTIHLTFHERAVSWHTFTKYLGSVGCITHALKIYNPSQSYLILQPSSAVIYLLPRISVLLLFLQYSESSHRLGFPYGSSLASQAGLCRKYLKRYRLFLAWWHHYDSRVGTSRQHFGRLSSDRDRWNLKTVYLLAIPYLR
jgi:hypothetical protein